MLNPLRFVLSGNTGAERFMGYSREEIIGALLLLPHGHDRARKAAAGGFEVIPIRPIRSLMRYGPRESPFCVIRFTRDVFNADAGRRQRPSL